MKSGLAFPAAAVLCGGIFFSCSSNVMFIAHRGASHDAPENTLASVNLAWNLDADAVEIDVYLSKDGRIVVIHDDTTKRTGGVDEKVGNQTLEELKRLDVGAFKGEQWIGERIPTLEEVIETIPEGKCLFVEIKCGKEILPELGSVLEKSGRPPGQVVIIGFDLKTVAAAKAKNRAHRVYWLSDIKRDEKSGTWRPTVEELIDSAKKAGVDGLNVRGLTAVDRTFVGKVEAAGMGCFVWTINDPKEALRLKEAGVKGITTDRPRWLEERVEEMEKRLTPAAAD